ncbi:ABC transporter ATP-binding protein [Polynucleobacter sp. IMCC 29146]|uniref:ABC transporter ATP-binding protein n=1 Tax=Polynucleobacter sp. IMCC 29146 TaxID=2780953 RepID=UPI00351D8E11
MAKAGSIYVMSVLLDVTNVSKFFGGVHALDNVGLRVPSGSIVGLIGPNGAGKTTFFNLITGLYSANSGLFQFNGQFYSPHSVAQVTQAGIARTFQNIRLFGAMTALENVMVGCHCRSHTGVIGAILRGQQVRQEERAIREKSFALLRYVGLGDFADHTAINLSYGHQRRLEIARALATDPLLLALDEPAAGMNATEKLALRELLLQIRVDGKTILLIEHDVSLVMGICDSLTVLDYGKTIAVGSPAEVRNSPAVIKAYLGNSP